MIGAAAAGAAAGATLAEPTFAPATGGLQPHRQALPPPAWPPKKSIRSPRPTSTWPTAATRRPRKSSRKRCRRTPAASRCTPSCSRSTPSARTRRSFEQTAAKLKGLTNGTGPEWEKAAALGRSIDPSNGLYAGAGGRVRQPQRPHRSAAPAAPAPTLDFDIGGAAQGPASAPDLTLEAVAKPDDSGLDFDVSGATQKNDISTDETLAAPSAESARTRPRLQPRPRPPPAAPTLAPATKPAPAADDPDLTFDLNLDLGGDQKSEAAPSAAPPARRSLEHQPRPRLRGRDAPAAPAGGTDPKWQEIATKLDLAKAYEEMGDKDGARELLNEVMKDGDAAQKGTAQQLLAKLG